MNALIVFGVIVVLSAAIGAVSQVLKNVQQYRSVAVAYVAGTTQALTKIDAELSDLRDRLSASSLEAVEIPLEVQLASIESSVRRLQEGSLSTGTRLVVENGI